MADERPAATGDESSNATDVDVDVDAATGADESAPPADASIGGAGPTDGASVVPAAPVGRRRWGVLAGLVLYAYAAFLAIEMGAAGIDTRAFGRLHQIQGNVLVRFVLAGVLLAALFHSLNGLRIIVLAAVPRWSRHDEAVRSLVQFLTFAVGIPGAFVIVWPSVWEWFT